YLVLSCTLMCLTYFLNHSALTYTYTLSLHDALPISTTLSITTYFNVTTEKARKLLRCTTHHQKKKRHYFYPRRFFVSGTCQTNRSEEHTSELQSRFDLVCRLLLEKKENILLS